MSDYKQCPNGHYYQGDHCPYCNSGGQTGQSVSVHCPYCGETIAVNVSSYDMHLPWNGKCKKCQHDFCIDNDVVRCYPSLPCPHCGKQVTGNVKEKWDWKCVNCGHDFSTDWIIIQKMEKGWSSLQKTRAEAECLSLMLSEQEMQIQKDKKVGDPSDYKQCPNGYYYQGENCPYCNLVGGKNEKWGDVPLPAGPVTPEMWRDFWGIKETENPDTADRTVGEYKQCNRGHYYKGDFCPYCKLDTSVVHPEMETEAANIPLCPHCGKPVRKVLPHCFNIGSIEGYAYDGKTPWNYNWNGRCENCGHDFSITMTQRIDSPHNDRQTIVRVSQRQVQEMTEEGDILLDAFVGLSGVEIEQRNNVDGVKTIFMSTNELKYLVNALKNSPLLEQLDFCADWT